MSTSKPFPSALSAEVASSLFGKPSDCDFYITPEAGLDQAGHEALLEAARNHYGPSVKIGIHPDHRLQTADQQAVNQGSLSAELKGRFEHLEIPKELMGLRSRIEQGEDFDLVKRVGALLRPTEAANKKTPGPR